MLKGAVFTCDASLGAPGAGAVNPVCEYSDSNGLSQPEIVDLNGDGTIDRVYAGDLHGNMWIFDISDTDTSSWGLHNTDNAPFFTACAADLEDNGFCHYDSRQPITGKPLIRNNPIQTGAINKLVFFGTGQYLTADDRASSIKQSFYTVWDVDNVTHSLDRSNLQAQVIDNAFNTGEASDYETRVINSTSVNYSTSSSEYGWYYENLPGLDGPIAERVILTPLLFSGVLVFQTLIPNEGLCNASAGSGYIMAVDPLTGGNPPIDVFLVDGVPYAAGILIDGFQLGGSFTKGDDGVKFNTDTADGPSVPLDLTGGGSTGGGVNNGIPGSLFPASGRKTWTILQ
jgi:type IV pilus assembly protein PilY1